MKLLSSYSQSWSSGGTLPLNGSLLSKDLLNCEWPDLPPGVQGKDEWDGKVFLA